ncbi:hypothetical protein, partial [Desulfogranum mediterraneum]|uniref:hypothetical protein n=1 Tax=Desulfogranum mediterraneum TaxID=160661 RepID=UPI001ABF4537
VVAKIHKKLDSTPDERRHVVILGALNAYLLASGRIFDAPIQQTLPGRQPKKVLIIEKCRKTLVLIPIGSPLPV